MYDVYRVVFHRVNDRGVAFTSHLQLAPRLKKE
jgi:hypothetical protein